MPKTKVTSRSRNAGGARHLSRRNSSEAQEAAALSEAFHGRPVRKVREVAEVFNERTELADLGRLIRLDVWIDENQLVTLEYERSKVRVGASADGGQLYYYGGDQALDLKKLGLDRDLPKDHVTVGPVQFIEYHTSKAFHNFEPTDYEHEFGEEGGELPILNYDVLSGKIYLTGGSYQVRPEGIVN